MSSYTELKHNKSLLIDKYVIHKQKKIIIIIIK
jgi:hypothetical protein